MSVPELGDRQSVSQVGAPRPVAAALDVVNILIVDDEPKI